VEKASTGDTYITEERDRSGEEYYSRPITLHVQRVLERVYKV
jgi:hypothetical protein